MKLPDLYKERREKKLSLAEFAASYNENLPVQFPKASSDVLRKFRKAYPALFKNDNTWSLDQHRKKFMDWHPQHIRSLVQ